MQKREEQRWITLTHRLKARHFVLLSSIYRHRTLRKVADELCLSQPAITKALREMEEIVGAVLFDRTSRGLTPTAAADVLALRSSNFLADLRNLADELIALQDGLRGVVRIGLIPFVAHSLLTKTMDMLRQQGFSYRFVICDGDTDTLVRMLRNHELDCVIARLTHENSGELEQEILYTQQPVLLSCRTYALPKNRKLTIKDFSNAEWVLPPKGTPTRRAFGEMLVQSKVVIREAHVETSSVSVIKAVLAADPTSVTLLPRDLADEIVQEGTWRVLPVDLDFSLPAVSVITRRDAQGDRTLDMLKRAIRASAV